MKVAPSYWELTSFQAPFDILVIGGGVVGCSAALHCKSLQPSLRIGIIEREVLSAGASSKNAGFASFGSLSEFYSDACSMGEAGALELLIKRKAGLNKLLHLLHPVEIDYSQTGGYEVFLEKDEDLYTRCIALIDRLNDLLKEHFDGDVFRPADEIAEKMRLKDVAHVIANRFEGVLHPGKMMQTFISMLHHSGITLMNGFSAGRIEPEDNLVHIISDSGLKLLSKYVIVATNAFTGSLIPNLPLYPVRNQVYMTEKIPGLKLEGCFHYDRGFVYFREVDGRVLIGGARNTDFDTENTGEFGLTDFIRNRLTDFLQKHVVYDRPCRVEYAWSGILGMGDDKSPIVRMVSERIAVAVRLSGIGVAIGSLVGETAADLILARL